MMRRMSLGLVLGSLACSVLLAGNAIAANGNPATSGLIFQDDFSSGDLSKKTAFFRWGDGTGFLAAGAGQPVVSVTGPQGTQVKAIRFSYGTFQEVRFALTRSLSEQRDGANGSSDVAYPELWTCYDLFIPTNFEHSTNGPGAVNDKWFVVYKNGYLTANSGVANFFEAVPDGKGNSIATMTDNAEGGLNRTTTSVISSDAVGSNSAAYAFRKSEAGQWHNYCHYTKVPTNATSRDGEMAVYKDGTLRYQWKNIPFWDPDGIEANAGFDRGYLLGYHNSVVPADPQVWYLTNFKIGTTAASVGVGSISSVPETPAAPVVLQASILVNKPVNYTNGLPIPSGTVISYDIYQGIKGASKVKVATTTETTVPLTSGLQAGVEYCFSVVAVVAGQSAAPSNDACKKFPPPVPQAAVITVQ